MDFSGKVSKDQNIPTELAAILIYIVLYYYISMYIILYYSSFRHCQFYTFGGVVLVRCEFRRKTFRRSKIYSGTQRNSAKPISSFAGPSGHVQKLG